MSTPFNWNGMVKMSDEIEQDENIKEQAAIQ